ncbi:Diguanylate cyclase [Cupriavidus sp. H18C1]|uniref:sensor domain-containing diguanylate cyclase n=1 Tax=Cupriavidus sp. H18C1 TaxID=3241601 RepID=UPI003BB93699
MAGLVGGGAVTLALLISLLGAAALYQMRSDILASEKEASANLALTLERGISRTLQVHDLAISGVVNSVRDPAVMSLPPNLRQRALFDFAINAEDMGSLFASDAQGNVLFDSQQWPPRSLNVADRDYFQAQHRDPEAGLYVSRPFQGRLQPSDKFLALSRRLVSPDGSFAGVVSGSLRLSYFRKLFNGVSLGAGGTVTLVRTDGTIVMRRPYDDAVIGRDMSKSAVFPPILRGSHGTFVGTTPIDGVRRLYSYHRTPEFPLVVVVGRAMTDVLAPWYRRVWAFGGIIAAVDLLIIALAAMLARQWRQRQAIEDHLRHMVGTDGLTGLGSRRALDDATDREWRRAHRERQPLSLLMLDVDHFKQFNDQYGHMAGDDALAAVGSCIQQQIRRPGDYAGRYGGEEFAVLLPGTDAAGAALIAENIRKAVERLHLAHAGSPLGNLTVSIGTVTDGADWNGGRHFPDVRAFLRAGDEALYQAKRSGRNRVVGSGTLATATATA